MRLRNPRPTQVHASFVVPESSAGFIEEAVTNYSEPLLPRATNRTLLATDTGNAQARYTDAGWEASQNDFPTSEEMARDLNADILPKLKEYNERNIAAASFGERVDASFFKESRLYVLFDGAGLPSPPRSLLSGRAARLDTN